MRTYSITDPSGKVHTIDGPEGATREQVIAKIQERLGQSRQQADPYTAQAQKQSIGENLLAGIGGGMTGLYLGAKQRLGLATPEEIEEHHKAMEGLRSTTAGTIGDIGGQVAAAVPAAFVPGANTYVGSALIGGGLGSLQPTREGQGPSVTENALLGAAGGAAGKYVGDKVLGLLRGRVQPQQNLNVNTNVSGQGAAQVSGGGSTFGSVGDDASAGLSVSQDKVLKRAREMGFKVTPGQASGSKALQQMESKLESQPMTSGTFNDIKSHNQMLLNRAAADSIGEKTNVVDSAVLSNAKDRISSVYDFVADDKIRKIPTDDFLGKLSSLEQEFEGLLPKGLLDESQVNKLFGLAQTGEATGRQLQQISSKLGKIAYKQMTTPSGDRDLGMVLNRIKDISDDYLESGLSGQTAKTFKEARQQYRNLMLLTQRQGVVNPASGDVSGGALASVLQQKDKTGYLFGKNTSPLYDAARFSQAFKPLVGNSGTATRSMITSPMDALLTLPFNIATKAYTSGPVVNAARGFGNGLSPELAAALQRYQLTRTLPQAAGGAVGANLNSY